MANPNDPFAHTRINSEGGSVIGGDARSSRDLAGRDIYNNYLPAPTQQPSLHQLPAPEKDFVGRADEIALFKEWLLKGDVVSISGMPGVGKTELARKIADELKSEFPDLQMEIDLRGTTERPKDGLEAIAEVIRAFGRELPKMPDEIKGVYRDCLNGKRVLLILDNAADKDQVDFFAPPSDCVCARIVTSRGNLPISCKKKLDTLPPDQAIGLLNTIAPQLENSSDSADIARLCGYLPIALRAAGAFLLIHDEDVPPEKYKEMLSDENKRLKVLNSPDVSAVFKVSYDRLNKDTQRFFRRVAGFLAPFNAKDASGITGESADRAESLLRDLLSKHAFITFNSQTKWYAFHELIQDFARSCWRNDEPEKIPDSRFKYIFGACENAERLFSNQKEGGQIHGLTEFDEIREHFERELAFQEKKAESSDVRISMFVSETYIRLVNSASYLIDLRFLPTQKIHWYKIFVNASGSLKFRNGEEVGLGNLGSAYYALGEIEKAIGYYEQALVISREIKNRRGEAAHLGNLGLAYSDLGEIEKAIGYYEQALGISREIKDRRGEGNHLGNLGGAYYDLGEIEKAIEYYEQALGISREIKDRRGEGNHLGNLGGAYYDLGEIEKAIEYYEQALGISREIKDRRGEGADLGNLGNAYSALGEIEKAIGYYEQALGIRREIKDRRGEGADLGNLGNAYRDLGETEKAIEYHEQALEISQEIKDRRGEGNHLGNLGSAYNALGEIEKAIELISQSLGLNQSVGNKSGVGYAKVILAGALTDDKPQEAITRFEQGRNILAELKNKFGVADAGYEFARAVVRRGTDAQLMRLALKAINESIILFDEMKSKRAGWARTVADDLRAKMNSLNISEEETAAE